LDENIRNKENTTEA